MFCFVELIFWCLNDAAWSGDDIKFTSFHRGPKLHPDVSLIVEIIVMFVHITGKYIYTMLLLVMLISFYYQIMRLNLSFYFKK